MTKLGVAIALLAALGATGCTRRKAPAEAPAVAAGPTLVEIRGKYPALSDLPAVKGILIDPRGQQQLADGTWSVNAYLSSVDLVAAIRSRGLEVKVLKSAGELARESEEMARALRASESTDARPASPP